MGPLPLESLFAPWPVKRLTPAFLPKMPTMLMSFKKKAVANVDDVAARDGEDREDSFACSALTTRRSPLACSGVAAVAATWQAGAVPILISYSWSVTARLGRYNRPDTLLVQPFKSPPDVFFRHSGWLSPFAVWQLLKAVTIGICPPEYLDPDQVFSIQRRPAGQPEGALHCPPGAAAGGRTATAPSTKGRFTSNG